MLKDDIWSLLLSLICLCLIVWLLVLGCASTGVEQQSSPETKEVESRRGLGSPEFYAIHNPRPWPTCAEEGVGYGWIDEAKTTWVWGGTKNGKLVWFLMVQVTLDEKFKRAWVDTDFDGKYDELIEDKMGFLAKYPDPCVAFHQIKREYY